MGLTKRADSFYIEFRVADDGKRLTLAPIGTGKLKRWKVGSLNRTLAKNQEAVIKTRLMTGELPSPQVERPRLFGDLVAAYLAEAKIKRQASYNDKKHFFEVKLLPKFGKMSADDITTGLIEDHLELRREDGLSIATINREIALWKGLYSYGNREDLTTANPTRRLVIEHEDNKRDRILSPEEFDKLQAESIQHLKDVCLTAYDTGMRKGEILRLTWDKVDFESGLICLGSADTKTKRKRKIPMTPRLTFRLRDLYKVRYLHQPRVFLVNGEPILSIKTAFNAACRRAGIKDFVFHDFRHTYATNLRRAGVDVLTIMAILGWTSVATMRRYQTFEDKDLREAAGQFNTLITRHPRKGDAVVSNSAI